jgi:hypothetical protein
MQARKTLVRCLDRLVPWHKPFFFLATHRMSNPEEVRTWETHEARNLEGIETALTAAGILVISQEDYDAAIAEAANSTSKAKKDQA